MVIPYENTLFVTTQAGRLHILDPTSGEVYVSLNVGQEIGSAAYPPALTDAVVVLVGQEGTLIALEMATEEPAWTTSLEGHPTAPLLGDDGWGFVTAGLEDGRLSVLSSAVTGRPLWQDQLPGPVIALAADWERIFAVAENGALLAWHMWEDEKGWSTELETRITAGPIVDNQTVILGTEAGQVLFVKAESGTLLADRTLDVEDPVTSLMPARGATPLCSAIHAAGAAVQRSRQRCCP